MQRPSRVLLISSCAMRAFFFFLRAPYRAVFFAILPAPNLFSLRFFVRHIVFFSAILRAPNRALNGATVTGHGQDTRYASDM